MANFRSGFFDTTNVSNKSLDEDVFFTTVTSPSDTGNLHPFYKTLFLLRISIISTLALMMLASNAVTLHAVWNTWQLRIKAYALTTSLSASNLVFSIVLFQYILHELLGMMPCSLKLYKAAVRPLERWISYVSMFENRVTPTVIRNFIVAIWVTAGFLSLPAYFGFIWPDPVSCIATLWPKFETVVEISIYIVSSLLVVVVYTRIWTTVMRIELQQQQQQQQQQPSRENAEYSVRTLWHQRRLIPKHRATRTTMVILVSFVCLYFPYMLTRLLGLMGMQFADLMQLMTSWVALMAFSSNAFVYAIFNQEFRRSFRRSLFYLIRCRGANDNAVVPAQ